MLALVVPRFYTGVRRASLYVVRPSVPSARITVRPSVRLSVRPSVRACRTEPTDGRTGNRPTPDPLIYTTFSALDTKIHFAHTQRRRRSRRNRRRRLRFTIALD